MAERDEKDAIEGTNTPEVAGATGPLPTTKPGGSAPSISTPAAPASAPVPTSTTPESATPIRETPSVEPGLQNDIARILATAQLPERRDVGHGKTTPQKTYDTGIGNAASPLPEEPQLRTPTPEAPAHKDALATVHTLKHDLQDVVRDQKISRVRAAAIESAKRRPEPIDATLPTKRTVSMGLIVSIIMLILIGIGALFAVYFFSLSHTQRQPTQANDSLVFAEATRSLPLDNKQGGAIKQDLALVRQEQTAVLGSITRIVPTYSIAAAQPTERLATTREFLSAIGAQAPEELLRALSDTFFLGTHTVDESAPFIVVPVISYDRAFAGMLAWENTMNADLAPFFTPLAPLVAGAGGIVVARTFSDDVNRNYDVRVLKDDSGTIQLYYSFPTRGMLVIAESPYTLSEAVTRLQAARRL